ncbi:MAG: PEGA domain-containing protein [Candidatus Omnitrophica bacterium]|nr:PEGA domain-containing protein [Candidatus Omnitrophota bacterium]
MRKLIACVLIALFSFSISGCATIITGTTQKVTITSSPEGAKLDVDGQSTFSTPATVTLERKRDHILVFSKEGYQQQTVTLLHVISGAVCGNILLGGLIGWGVDACTGAQYKLVPEIVNVQMQKVEGNEATTFAPKALTTEDKVNQLKNMYDKGQLTKEEYEANKKVLLYQMTKEGASAGKDTVGGSVVQVSTSQVEKK